MSSHLLLLDLVRVVGRLRVRSLQHVLLDPSFLTLGLLECCLPQRVRIICRAPRLVKMGSI